MQMEFDENSLVATMNPILLIACFAVVVLAAYICARKYRNTNDFKKSSQLYGAVGVCLTIVFWIAGVPGIMAIGYALCGFIIMALFSNHFFYH